MDGFVIYKSRKNNKSTIMHLMHRDFLLLLIIIDNYRSRFQDFFRKTIFLAFILKFLVVT